MADKEELIKQLSDKYHVPPSKVRKAVESQFEFVSRKMREDGFPSIRLPFFGLFKVNPNRVKHLNKNKKNAERRKANQQSQEQSKEES